MTLICSIFGHKWVPTSFIFWRETKANFKCTRCNKQVCDFQDTFWKNRNKEKNMQPSIAIQRFAERMQFKLDKNKHKDCKIMNPNNTERGWYHFEYYCLLLRLK